MNVTTFMTKWRLADLTERSGAHQHFCDLCELVDHPKPATADPKGEWFAFEKGATKPDGSDGWADVWKKDYFAWEYKKKHKDLDRAYKQLLQYREALDRPPLLVVCDMDRIVVHTDFTRMPTKIYELTLLGLEKPENLEIIKAVFHHPETLKPGVSREAITQQAAARLAEAAQRLRDRGFAPHKVARFLDRIVFCLFAEDIGLLPKGVFAAILKEYLHEPEAFAEAVGDLFAQMAGGGRFGHQRIRHFDGNLFEDVEVLPLEYPEIDSIRLAAALDWDAVDASIFGTLFERGMDPSKRAQLGAHYTSRDDIDTLVEPVVMAPLRREWDQLRTTIETRIAKATPPPKGKKGKKKASGEMPLFKGALEKAQHEGEVLVNRFLQRLSRVTVLDPACGSGNFLYVTLQKLKDLEKEVMIYAGNHGLGTHTEAVGPWQLHGIELSPYAFELAQLTVWIGYLQWLIHNGFDIRGEPILRPMDTFECKDAILDLSDPEHPKEPTWPKVDFIVGNPPFLGTKKLRGELGDEYVEALFAQYGGRIPNFSDLCCYWFEKARAHLADGDCRRVGLLATQGIRGGLNRKVLKRVLESGAIFFAESDRPWVLDGALVHVSFVGFDDGVEDSRCLDGRPVAFINANLTGSVDTTAARKLPGNAGIGYIGDVKAGKFDLAPHVGSHILHKPNPHGRPNSDVLLPWVNARDVVQSERAFWIVDFGGDMPMDQAALYEAPFAHVERVVYPARSRVKRRRYRDRWWLHAEPCIEMRSQVNALDRFLVTPMVSKHRVFAWLVPPVLADHTLIAFARRDDYFLGVVHSRPHEIWSLSQGTQLRERQSGFRYTPTTCFETFPFPEPTSEQAAAIAEAAGELNELRERWLNPPEWVREEILEFPGTVGGPWTRYIEEEGSGLQVPGSGEEEEPQAGARNPEPGTRNPEPETRNHPRTGTVRYPRLVPRDAACAKRLKQRTLTNLYNARPTWLDMAHRKLDAAVFAAYGWPPDLGDEAILEKLLALNLERAGQEESGTADGRGPVRRSISEGG